MARARQGIISKRKATNKKAKYTIKTQKTVSQVARNGRQTTKYAYTKKIMINGKYRYYYS